MQKFGTECTTHCTGLFHAVIASGLKIERLETTESPQNQHVVSPEPSQITFTNLNLRVTLLILHQYRLSGVSNLNFKIGRQENDYLPIFRIKFQPHSPTSRSSNLANYSGGGGGGGEFCVEASRIRTYLPSKLAIRARAAPLSLIFEGFYVPSGQLEKFAQLHEATTLRNILGATQFLIRQFKIMFILWSRLASPPQHIDSL